MKEKKMCDFRSLFFTFIFIANTCWGSRRILKSELNPGCGKLCEEMNVTTFHVRADGTNDTLHYLWDFVGRPSILLAITPTSAKLDIDWEKYLSGEPKSINFTEEPAYTFAIVIEKILEFNDVKDTGFISSVNDAFINVLNPENFQWTLKSQNHHESFVELHMQGENYRDPFTNETRNGNIQIILNSFCELEHSDVVPRMLHSENSTQIDFIIDHLQTNRTFNQSRYGVELLIVSPGSPDDTMVVESKKSLDDEYSPGVFQVVEMKTPRKVIKNARGDAQAYLQWRPVSYTTSERDITNSTETTYYELRNCSILEKNSMLYGYYGDKTDNLLMEKFKVTIGITGDGFFNKTGYSTWTFILGYGSTPVEQFSNLIIMIISIGVGLPIIIMSVAAFYACVQRFTRPAHGHVLTNS